MKTVIDGRNFGSESLQGVEKGNGGREMDEINKAIELLKQHGYIVIQKTRRMEKDSAKCDKMAAEGENMACLECACNLCVL